MNKLIEKFRCQEYLGEKYQLGLYHPHDHVGDTVPIGIFRQGIPGIEIFL